MTAPPPCIQQSREEANGPEFCSLGFAMGDAVIRQCLEGAIFAAIGVFSIQDGVRLSAAARREGVFDLIGPDRYIMVIGAILIMIAIAHVANAFITRRVIPADGPGVDDAAVENKFGVLVSLTAAFAGYAIFAPLAGYAATTLVFFCVTYFIMGVRGWLGVLGASIITAAVFVLIFSVLSSMPLPRGILGLPT